MEGHVGERSEEASVTEVDHPRATCAKLISHFEEHPIQRFHTRA